MPQGEGADWEESGSSGDEGAAAAGWVPAEGETVRVLKMGGAAGKVVSAASRSGGKVGVRVGSMTVELRLADLAPAGGAAAGQAAPAAARQQKGSSGSSAGGLRAAAKQLRARGALRSSTGSDSSSDGPSYGGIVSGG